MSFGRLTLAQRDRVLAYVVLFVIFFLMGTSITSFADDLVFKAAIERYNGFFGWVSFFSQNWGGRIVPQGLLVLILQLPDFVFTAVNAAMWVLLLAYVNKCFNRARSVPEPVVMGAFGLSVFVMIPVGVLQGTVFWKCANVLYLWGSALAFVALFPIVGRLRGLKVKPLDYVYAALGVFYTAGFEQMGVFMCVAMALLAVVDAASSKQLRIEVIVLVLWSIACTVWFCALPGNSERSAIEVLGQYQSYGMFSTLDKVMLGISYALGNLEAEAPIILFGLSIIAVYGVRVSGRSPMMLAGCCLVLAYFGFCLICQIGLACSGNAVFGAGALSLLDVTAPVFGVGKVQVAKEILNVACVVFLGAVLASLSTAGDGAIVMVCYFGGLATMVMMGFSPTFLASGMRPHFICFLLMLCVMLQCATQVYELGQSRSSDAPLIGVSKARAPIGQNNGMQA